ncbi:MAG TPA: hypothetical protein VFS43_21075 [Polyangiaceae bacterium]|nr:hypothetical protein [Polyangiaceae bacterium]
MGSRKKAKAASTFAALVALAVGVRPSTLRADTPNVVVADLGLHVVGVGYERVFSDRWSAQAAAEFYSPWTVNRDFLGLGGSRWDGTQDLAGGGLRVRAFFTPLGGPGGLFVSPFVQAMAVRATVRGEAEGGAAWAAGAAAGYGFLLGERVLLRLGAGAQYHAARVRGGDEPPGFSGLFPHLDLNVGYRF